MVCGGGGRGGRSSFCTETVPATIFPVTAAESTVFAETGRRRSRRSSQIAGEASRDRVEKGAEMGFPMYLMSWEVLMGLQRMTAHQTLKRKGQLAEFSEELLGRVFLISHEWLGYSHPDPAGEQLRELKSLLTSLASGGVDVQSDWKQQFFNRENTKLEGRRLTAVLPQCYFWLDYAGVPQNLDGESEHHNGADHRFDGGDVAKEMAAAVASIPAYVERSAVLLILTPTCQHLDALDRVCGFASWRGRGWCRVEAFAALLSRTRVRLMRCIAARAAPEFVWGGDMAALAPGEGAYTCCARAHCIDGLAVECDKVRISAVAAGMLLAAARHFGQTGDAHRQRVMLCNEERLLRGLPPVQGAAPSASRSPDLATFQGALHWGPADDQAARARTAPSLLHWAALAGNAAVVQALLAADRSGINRPMPCGAAEFGLVPLLPPLHLAIAGADGTAAAAHALLDARADVEVRDRHSGNSATMHAAVAGTVEQLEEWLRRFPNWQVNKFEGMYGATLIMQAVFTGPAKAPFLRLLMACKADPRCGTGSVAAVDAALLGACTKDDSDPEVVALLLAAKCSPNARVRPTMPNWRAIYLGMRLAARWARLRGRRPGPLVAMMADGVGSTPLHFAARTADVAVVRLLLQAQADPALRNAMGRTALDMAREHFGGRAPELVEELFKSPPDIYLSV